MKWSFKNENPLQASSVVQLADGVCLEVRRGEKTTWNATEERQRWNSLDEWKAQLPPGSEPTDTTGKTSTEENPDVVLYLKAWKRGTSRKFVSNLHRSKSRAENIRIVERNFAKYKEKRRYEIMLKYANCQPEESRYHRVDNIKHPSVRVQLPGTNKFVPVYYNQRVGVFGLGGNSSKYGKSFAELGFVQPLTFLVGHNSSLELVRQEELV